MGGLAEGRGPNGNGRRVRKERGSQLRRAPRTRIEHGRDQGFLPGLRGVEWKNGWMGRAEVGGHAVELRRETERWVDARLVLDAGIDTGEALAANAKLAGTVRYAGPPRARALIGEAWLGGPAPAAALRGTLTALASAADGRHPRSRRARGSPEQHEDAVQRLREQDGLDVAQLDREWEVTQRVRGRRVALRISPERGGLRVHSGIRPVSEAAPASRAVADLAVRLNTRFRLARFACVAEDLVVEARVPSSSVDTETLSATTRAIGVAVLRAVPLFDILASEPHVAERYAHTFHLTQGG